MAKKISTKVFKQLYRPDIYSHKGDNGRLLLIAGSEKYHGSLIYAVRSAARVVGLVYVLSTENNQRLVGGLKGLTAGFIPVKKISEAQPDAVLIGPGMGVSIRTYNLVKQVLNSGKKIVLDADALNVLDGSLKRKLSPNIILTPHQGEFKKVFGCAPTRENLCSVSKKYHCYIALKGGEYHISDPAGNLVSGRLSRPGASKGGVGDILSGLMAAFFCQNPADLAAAAAFLAVEKASSELYKSQKHFYSSEDLCEQLPKTLAGLV